MTVRYIRDHLDLYDEIIKIAAETPKVLVIRTADDLMVLAREFVYMMYAGMIQKMSQKEIVNILLQERWLAQMDIVDVIEWWLHKVYTNSKEGIVPDVPAMIKQYFLVDRA